MKTLIEMNVGDIVAHNFRASSVLSAHGIDFCCGGGKRLVDVCKEKEVSIEAIIQELEVAFTESPAIDYLNVESTDLIDHIVSVHHKYVEATIPALKMYLDKLCHVHGSNHPELFEIRELFFGASEALTAHMEKEELILFPYINAMCNAKKNAYPLSRPHFGDIQNPIDMMEDEHETEGERFRKIARLSNDYRCPDDGCQTYHVAYAMLKEFEEDLHTHIHLENNILFPAAKQLFRDFDFPENRVMN